ncbi:SPOR domain-containing protein [Arsenophonus nasoniae]|uniref:Cell division protein DamX n=1 Tax=Arsenophonus nasoniae TaxID=638 RepID=D2U376_9GAMM|nr:SPOR domain-containing protein [Arsenophonus nasoniae]QBY42113.1 Cell division protein DamX [Arsenophonus nasoniae]WGL95452.1 SPOR domain-containing protein [Arsenophonus nasoniae]WGM02061.1 SPOR domain-containing protein [Arsenophonus nasoniae]WGM06290.1 SPOR domain-containing protein [Arsenophonus nasoniae]WGM11227.1 SPOR domain-containing protein [Arsenophonus nasoniae]
MDEFKPERDPQDQSNFRPDTSDRPVLRSRQQGSKHHLASRQHVMIGIAVLVLLLLIIAISSALKAPTDHEKEHTSVTNNERNIDISKTTSLANESSLSQEHNQPQNVTMPSISDTPTEGSLPPANQGQGKRIEIPGDVVDALRQGQTLPTTKQQLVENPTSTPSSTILPSTTPPKIVEPIKTNPETKTKPIVRTHTHHNGDLLSSPASNYTLQLSSASRSNSLEAFAKKNRLTNYKIYKTVRNGQPWYVLIHGNYRSVSEAKNAISTLPTSVQEKKPWVRKFQQVKQDQK